MSSKNGISSQLSPLDMKILQALQIAPRIPFALVAPALDVSEQTVARRYRRMCRDGVVRVTAVVNPAALGQSNWAVRAQCRPSGAASLAQALARRDDVSWVSIVAGGSEVICTLRSRTERARDDLLIERLPRTTQVLSLSASVVMHTFAGGADEFTGLGQHLSAAEERVIRGWREPALDLPARSPARTSPLSATEIPTLTASDLAMLGALVADGRASYTTLAAAAGVTQGRAVRRLRTLLLRGIAYLDVDFAMDALGYRCPAVLWLTVAPAQLDSAGRHLATFGDAPFVAAVSGSANLMVSVTCRDLTALYGFLTEKVSTVEGIRSMEVAPVLRAVKQAGALMSGNRLAH